MPFAGFDDWGDCVQTMTGEEGHDQEAAESICGALEAERKSDHGDPEGLMDALERGGGLIADVGVDLVSGVDVPAVDSKWVMTKDAADTDGHDFRASSPILLSKADDADQRISYAAAMIPREPDKEGDVVATPTVEKAAHDFIKQQGGVDTDHSLIDGEGDVVESWVLKDEREFDLPGGETETYGPGTWMVGIEWGKEAWDRIKAGELTGLSIYGMAEHVPLGKAATCAECGDALSEDTSQNGDTHKGDGTESEDMAPDQTSDGGGDADGAGDSTDDGGPTIGEVAASVDDLAGTVESLKEAVETDKDGEQEAAATIAEQFDDVRPGDVLDIVEAAASRGVEAVLEAAENAEAEAKEDDEDEDEDDEEMEESVDKRADEANLGKGGDATETASKGVNAEASGGTGLSYRAIAEEQEGA